MSTNKPGQSTGGMAVSTTPWGQTVPTSPSGPSAIELTAVGERPSARERLLELRANMPDRAQRETVLVNRVARWLKTMPVSRLAFFMPIRGEPDITRVITAWLAEDRTRTAALPVVVGEMLEFHAWTPATMLAPGAYGIPVPQGTAAVQPQVLLIPCVGVDMQRYRLGYGRGYYDRTLGAQKLRPVTVGVCFDVGRLKSIAPQPHDVRLDLVIFESGVL